jgi:sterol desaturase/sphingolipid hydroxylase (fatty acid hydroxylase superfamily)
MSAHDSAEPAASTGATKFAAEWNWRPLQPVELSPLFVWPIRPLGVLKWIAASWFALTERLVIVLLAFVTWFWLQPALERCVSFELGWIAQIYGRNLGLMVLVAGGLHLYLYTFCKQGRKRKYDGRDLVADHRGFTFRSQVLDNMFWTLASGVTVWTGFEVLVVWGYANGYVPYLTWSDSPVWFVLLFFLIPIWGSLHFYWIHRLLHWPPLYRFAHALHHRNTNIGPWSGMSMHPVEHVLYLSTGLIHCVVASHPVHFLFHMQVKALEAVSSHSGFECFLVADRNRMRLGDFFHQMHHRYFECNYGTLEMPWDKWFGSFHDGTEDANARIRERRRRLKSST